MDNCTHMKFHAEVSVNRIDDGKYYSADVRIWCRECGRSFSFLGLKYGTSFNEPRMSANGHEARLPIEIDRTTPLKS